MEWLRTLFFFLLLFLQWHIFLLGHFCGIYLEFTRSLQGMCRGYCKVYAGHLSSKCELCVCRLFVMHLKEDLWDVVYLGHLLGQLQDVCGAFARLFLGVWWCPCSFLFISGWQNLFIDVLLMQTSKTSLFSFSQFSALHLQCEWVSCSQQFLREPWYVTQQKNAGSRFCGHHQADKGIILFLSFSVINSALKFPNNSKHHNSLPQTGPRVGTIFEWLFCYPTLSQLITIIITTYPECQSVGMSWCWTVLLWKCENVRVFECQSFGLS